MDASHEPSEGSEASKVVDTFPLQTSSDPTGLAAAQNVKDAAPSPSSNDADSPQAFDEDDDEATRLEQLSAIMRDQDDLEQAVGNQADQALLDQADERDQKRLERSERDIATFRRELHAQRSRLEANPHLAQRLNADISVLEEKIKAAENDCKQINARINKRHENIKDAASTAEQAGNLRRPGESQRDFLIRTGKITPFSRMGQAARAHESLNDVLMDVEEGVVTPEDEDEAEENENVDAKERSHRNLIQPGFANLNSEAEISLDGDRSRKRRRLRRGGATPPSSFEDSDFHADKTGDSSEAFELSQESDEGPGFIAQGTDGELPRGLKRSRDADSLANLADVDDGNEKIYQARLKKWESERSVARARATSREPQADDINDSQSELPEYMQPHPTEPDEVFDGGLRVPGDIFPALFAYQKTGVRWLWELYQQKVGGIIGDEMGLGKTIQVISFIAALHHSGQLKEPVIVVCPATILKQWSNEFHKWWPALRVSILHTSGSGMLDLKRESQIDDDLDNDTFPRFSRENSPTNKKAKRIVDRVVKEGHVLVTTYSGLQTYSKEVIGVKWGYAILDEGHKIRNPNTSMTIYCKELRTHNRIILSGTPMQNNLTELWSLFDFVYPMRLGTLISFRDTFETPIKQGGYANASNLQVETAYNCAEALKDSIGPYLLQRWKSDVASDLPEKSERVLFCKLTSKQLSTYERYLASDDHKSVEMGKRKPLYSIDILRKICNHPDLTDHKHIAHEQDYGAEHRSGKMRVVKALLQLWAKTGHKTLLFAQHRIMLDILEKFIKSLPGINYRRMDGNTLIKTRQAMVDEFNKVPDIHVFLLTTKVGGLGVNLVGADRVIIYDPDWNPSTDIQARERAWRLGQKREVMIFRLMTAGTIEEKIYHRQLFKQFLTNKVLRDPKQRQTFQLRGLQDLFTLGPTEGQNTETGGLFAGSEVRLSPSHGEKSSAVESSSTDPRRDAGATDAQISSIRGISHSEDINSRPRKEQKEDGDSQNHFMESLLGANGVSSAFNHDSIVGHESQKKGAIFADPAIISREAKKVAAQAAQQLRAAEVAARTVPIGTPSWTGEMGVAGRPEQRSARGGLTARRGRGGPSSGSVISNLAGRQAGQDQAGNSGGLTVHRGIDFMTRIRDFMKVHDGRVVTRMLIEHFNRYCTTAQRSANFREILREVADLDQPRGAAAREGRGTWVLKREYGGPGL